MINMNLINKKYGKKFQEHLLEQYKLYVNSSLDVTSKRLETNKFFLTLNSIIFGFTSIITTLNNNLVIALFSIIGIIVSVVWLKNIVSYKELNCAKFKVIHELEKYLPASLFKTEEEHYLNRYYGFTSIEKFVPITFIILYILLTCLIFFQII